MIIIKARASLVALAAAATVAIGAVPLASTASARPRSPTTPKPSAQSKQWVCDMLWSDFSANVDLEDKDIAMGLGPIAVNAASDAAAADMKALREYGCIA